MLRVVLTLCFCLLQVRISTSHVNPPSVPNASPKLIQQRQAREDYSNGFPSGFTQGLPTFDFSGPIASASQADQSSAEADNIGFVHGPPEGFPSLSQLGGDFPSYGGERAGSSRQGSKVNQHREPTVSQPEYREPVPNSANAGSETRRRPAGPRRPQKPPRLNKGGPRPQGAPSPNLQHRPEPGTSGSGPHGQHILAPPHHHDQYQPRPHPQHPPSYQSNQPIVLKVSSKRTRPTKLPPPIPPFYAPSPDYQAANHKNEGPPALSYNQRPAHQRQRREILLEDKVKGGGANASADQLQDGTDDTYWEVASPYIAFDNYEDEHSVSGQKASNRSSSDHDAGEQRFFPSFPSTNPYLSGIHPYISAPSRPPIFPGPSANRSPARSHQFGPKFGHAHSHRGGVYSAESHDHGDRYVDNNLLGSGNFEVVRGGTFYEDEESYHPGFLGGGQIHQPTAAEGGGDYYHHNGHSSPSGFGQQGDFFANFRDFADINPHSRAFSHNHASTVNLESAASERRPESILDKLESRTGLADSAAPKSGLEGDRDPMMATF